MTTPCGLQSSQETLLTSPLCQTLRAALSATTNNSFTISILSQSATLGDYIFILRCVNEWVQVLRLGYTDSPEGAPLHILPTESQVDSIFEEGPEGHVLAQSPVHLTLPH